MTKTIELNEQQVGILKNLLEEDYELTDSKTIKAVVAQIILKLEEE